ncbi:uncharacterized protein HD556DRAFT_1391492 [Suillus plorans]|uniref:NACHT domain-containing protein n=1 Tax=Suillus plorans TaxID=116603 RepID=A0A9P7AIV6_9AGAM|nr:uncharacterized protein HD556DRAFT_1391492 [Suillus plorans]KAG1790393.1 hypothetical protein HD556DRAFT_1391492 [Suillus plorans]
MRNELLGTVDTGRDSLSALVDTTYMYLDLSQALTLSFPTMDFMHTSSSNDPWRSLCNVVEHSGIFDSEKRQPHLRCMENTRVNLWGSLRRLLRRRDQTNVWLNGCTGIGKTSIAFTVAEEFKRAGRLAATFFFSHKHAQIAGKIIPTIAYQLALTFPRIRGDIIQAIEKDEFLLSSEKSRVDQMRELVINPLHTLRFCQERPYVIIIDALDECFSCQEAARLARLFVEMLSGTNLPTIHLIFTSRPDAHIRAAMPPGVCQIPLTICDSFIVQDVHCFLRASLDNIRTSRPDVFGRPPKPWPSEAEFETLASRTCGLLVYAAMVVKFLSPVGQCPQQRLDLLLRQKSAFCVVIDRDINQLYQQIIATSENPALYCRMLASIRLMQPLPLRDLQELFHADKESLGVMLEAFSPVISNPPDGVGNVEIYHASLHDFIKDPFCSGELYVSNARAHEYLACRCIDLLTRTEPAYGAVARNAHRYAHFWWGTHLSSAYPSSELRHLLARFKKQDLKRLVAVAEQDQSLGPLIFNLREARNTCFSWKWIRSLSDIVVAWRIVKASRKVYKEVKKSNTNVTNT